MIVLMSIKVNYFLLNNKELANSLMILNEIAKA